jgi:hypothetical protein
MVISLAQPVASHRECARMPVQHIDAAGPPLRLFLQWFVLAVPPGFGICIAKSVRMTATAFVQPKLAPAKNQELSHADFRQNSLYDLDSADRFHVARPILSPAARRRKAVDAQRRQPEKTHRHFRSLLSLHPLDRADSQNCSGLHQILTDTPHLNKIKNLHFENLKRSF